MTTEQRMSVEETRRVLEAYFSGAHADVSTLADDAVSG